MPPERTEHRDRPIQLTVIGEVSWADSVARSLRRPDREVIHLEDPPSSVMIDGNELAVRIETGDGRLVYADLVVLCDVEDRDKDEESRICRLPSQTIERRKTATEALHKALTQENSVPSAVERYRLSCDSPSNPD